MTSYKSKTGPGIILLAAIVFGLLLFFAVKERSWALFAIFFLGLIITFYIFQNTLYIISDKMLWIKSGFLFNETIAIDAIKSITVKRKHLLSGPGFSVYRLIILYDDSDCVIISPLEKEKFIEHLTMINPQIIIH